MKASKLIELLQSEINAFGDKDIVVFCPEHSGEHGNNPMPVAGLGWYGDAEKDFHATFIVCAECHAAGIAEKALSDAMDEIDSVISPDEPDTFDNPF